MIAVIDYGAGNLRSVEKSVAYVGGDAKITADGNEILRADGVILPGVGAFGDAAEKLRTLEPIIRAAVESGKPFLGICLGLQLLFEESEESPGVRGLGIFKGKTYKIPPTDAGKIPHMGWNTPRFLRRDGIFENVAENTYFYFVHSYYVDAADKAIVAAQCDYGVEMDVALSCGNVFGTQFHPEKSGDAGLAILKNFCERAGA